MFIQVNIYYVILTHVSLINKLRILLNHIMNTCIDLFSVIGGHYENLKVIELLFMDQNANKIEPYTIKNL